MNVAGMESIDRQVVGTICRNLADAGLIEWKPLRGAQEGLIVGMARITGSGVDVIEGRASPSISVVLARQENVTRAGETRTAADESANLPAGVVGVAATGRAGSFVPDTQSWDVAAQIAASQPRLNAALQPNPGETIPATTPATRPAVTTSQTVNVQTGLAASLDTNVTRATIPIVPTLYPVEPANGAIMVQNFITIDTSSIEFREFNEKIGDLIKQIQRSNEISGEVREKLIAEMVAGIEILKSPKPDPNLIDLLLRRPLVYVADKAAGAIISALATAALLALGKLTGLF